MTTATKTEDEMDRGLFLNVVIPESSPVFELLSGKDQSLLVRRNSFLVLDFRLDVVDRIRALDFKGNGLTSQSFDENLHGRTVGVHFFRSKLTNYSTRLASQMPPIPRIASPPYVVMSLPVISPACFRI